MLAEVGREWGAARDIGDTPAMLARLGLMGNWTGAAVR
jgi:hypothetical protein